MNQGKVYISRIWLGNQLKDVENTYALTHPIDDTTIPMELSSENISTILELAQIYRDGPKRNLIKSELYYLKATTLGDHNSWYELGMLYKVYSLSQTKMFEYFSRGAEVGNVLCQFNLAISYLIELGTNKNVQKATQLALDLSNAGEPLGYFILSVLHRDKLIEPKASSEDAFKKSVELISRCLDTKLDIVATYMLGCLYLENPYYRSEKRVIDHFEKVCRAGYADGFIKLGKIYYDGNGVKKDFDLALYYMEESFSYPIIFDLDVCFEVLHFNIATIYRKKLLFDKAFISYKRVVQTCTNTTESKSIVATSLRHLGHMYRKGNSVPKDTKKAMNLYIKAVNLGDKTSKSYISKTLPKDELIDFLIQRETEREGFKSSYNHLLYSPGGIGYSEAKDQFESAKF